MQHNNRLKIDDVYLIDDDRVVEMKVILAGWESKRPEFDDEAELVEYPKNHFMEEARWAYFHRMLSEEERIRQLYRFTIKISRVDILEPAPATEKAASRKTRKWENKLTGEKVEQEGPKLRFKFNRTTGSLDIAGPEEEHSTPLGKIYNIPIERILESWDDVGGVMKAVRVSVHPSLHTERGIAYFDPNGSDKSPIGMITDYDLYIEKQTEDRIYFNLILKDDSWGRFLVKFKVLKNKLGKLKEDGRPEKQMPKYERKHLFGTKAQEIEVDGKIQLPFHKRFKALYRMDDVEFRIERFGYDIFVSSDQGRLQGYLRYRPAFELVVENHFRYVLEDRRVGSVTALSSYPKVVKFIDWIRSEGEKVSFKMRNYREVFNEDLHKFFPEDERFLLNELKKEVNEEIVDRGLQLRAERLRDQALAAGHNPAHVLMLYRKMLESNDRTQVDPDVYEDYLGYINRNGMKDFCSPEDLLKGRIEFDDAQEAEVALEELIANPPDEPYEEKDHVERYRFNSATEVEEGNAFLNAIRRRQRNEWDEADGSTTTATAHTVRKAMIGKKKKGVIEWREIDERKPYAHNPMRRNTHSTLEDRRYTMYTVDNREITEEFLKKFEEQLKRRAKIHRLGKSMRKIHRKVVSKVAIERQEAIRNSLPKPKMKKV